ncbi:MAG: HigA family addiction module antidote protein [Bifidobacteriaceae bacterium]|jgi:HTH-type transcriptional regulator/antitoxin HigA|nr:HigA family addiction module antidote protein [Bifidobacteriaceae bacterium]
MSVQATRLPNYAVPVGDWIDEWMEDEGVNAAELARRLGVSRKHVSELLRAKVALTEEMAIKLSRVTGIDGDWLMRLEALYREDKARLAREAELAKGYDVVKRFPLTQIRE